MDFFLKLGKFYKSKLFLVGFDIVDYFEVDFLKDDVKFIKDLFFYLIENVL